MESRRQLIHPTERGNHDRKGPGKRAKRGYGFAAACSPRVHFPERLLIATMISRSAIIMLAAMSV